MNLKKIIMGVTLLSFFLTQYATAESEHSITYKNQRGSMLSLIWHKGFENTGTLTGTFKTAVGECKEDVGVPVPITGYFNGNAASITVNFPHCKQVVAMAGNFSKDYNNLHMLWLDTRQANDASGKDWNSNIIGTDSYSKIN